MNQPTPQNIQTTIQILTTGKALAPGLFPQPNPTTTQAWATHLPLHTYPPELWIQATAHWANNVATDKQVKTRDIIQAAQHTAQTWERNPHTRHILETHRNHRIAQNHHKLKTQPHKQLTTTPKTNPQPHTTPKRIQPTQHLKQLQKTRQNG